MDRERRDQRCREGGGRWRGEIDLGSWKGEIGRGASRGRWQHCEDGSAARRDSGSGGYNGGGNNDDVLMAGDACGCTDACNGGGDGDGGWTPSLTFHEQPFEREETPFFPQMMARLCGGSHPLL